LIGGRFKVRPPPRTDLRPVRFRTLRPRSGRWRGS